MIEKKEINNEQTSNVVGINTKQFIEELLRKLRVNFDSVDIDESFGQEIYKIRTTNSSILIGSHGDVLRAINHIVKKTLVEKGMETKFMIDVNDYRSKQIEEVQKTAKLLAERAVSLKYDVEMQPMSSYERMLVHSALDSMENITTESAGSGRERRVVIKYSG